MRRAVITSVCALVMAQAFGGAADLEAQVRMRNSDAQRLRSAAALESRGDYDGAEAVLFELLEERPDGDVLRNHGEDLRNEAVRHDVVGHARRRH